MNATVDIHSVEVEETNKKSKLNLINNNYINFRNHTRSEPSSFSLSEFLQK